MDCEKVGSVIRKLRQDKQMTQKQLAEALQLSDKTISKWECGLGCPDVSLLAELASLLEVNIESILTGTLTINDFVGGNMKQSKYFVCPICGNISVCTGSAEVSCCDRKLEALVPQKAEKEAMLTVEHLDDDWHVMTNHPMTKEHYISFLAFATGERIQLIKQYPEWDFSVRMQKRGHGMLLWYCTQHGLFYQLI